DTKVITIDKQQHLPDRWYGYDGVDFVVIAAAPEMDKTLLNSTSVDALEHWVRLGGALAIVCASGADRVFAAGAPLARFAPGEFDSMITLSSNRFISPIESFAANEGNGDSLPQLNAQSIRVPQWKSLRAVNGGAAKVVLKAGVQQAEVPLIVRFPLGFGQ